MLAAFLPRATAKTSRKADKAAVSWATLAAFSFQLSALSETGSWRDWRPLPQEGAKHRSGDFSCLFTPKVLTY